VEHVSVTTRVGIGPMEGPDRRYGLAAELRIRLPGLERGPAEALVHTASQVCPYSNAVRGNIDVQYVFDDPPLGS
jgi:osmotically inducible protein OsmC